MNNPLSSPGTYLLLFECAQLAELAVGRLGCMTLQPGYYLYVGSAFGPGGVQARIKHHAQLSVNPHWHIDYLRGSMEPEAAWCSYGSRREHEWAQALTGCEGMLAPMKGFGSSDCNCYSHLFHSAARPVMAALEKRLGDRLDAIDIGALGL